MTDLVSNWYPTRIDKDVAYRIGTDIAKAKRKLVKKVKEKGLIYENFGQKEVRQLRDKYFDYFFKEEGQLINEFDDWCMNYTGKD